MLQVCGAGRLLPRTTNAFMPFQSSKFQKSFFVAWSESNVAAVDGGHTLQLSLDRKSGELLQCLWSMLVKCSTMNVSNAY